MEENKRKVRSHYKIVNGKLVEKEPYESEMDALTMARWLNSKPYVIHKMVAYKCIKCNKWHVGNNGRLLTDEDREEARKKLENYKHKIGK